MKRFLLDKYQLFFTSFVQVILVTMNVLFIAEHKIVEMLICGFLISMIWTFNVKRAAFGGMTDRLVYASGALVGTMVGYAISNLVIKHL